MLYLPSLLTGIMNFCMEESAVPGYKAKHRLQHTLSHSYLLERSPAHHSHSLRYAWPPWPERVFVTPLKIQINKQLALSLITLPKHFCLLLKIQAVFTVFFIWSLELEELKSLSSTDVQMLLTACFENWLFTSFLLEVAVMILLALQWKTVLSTHCNNTKSQVTHLRNTLWKSGVA